jgi:FAD-binding domain
VPYLSNTQWHPFTVSSAPNDDFLEFHIGPVGDWTTDLYKLATALTAVAKVPSPLPDVQETDLFIANAHQPMYTSSNRNRKQNIRIVAARCSPPRRCSILWLWDVGSSIINLGAEINAASTTDTVSPSGYSSTEGTSSGHRVESRTQSHNNGNAAWPRPKHHLTCNIWWSKWTVHLDHLLRDTHSTEW